MKQLVRSTPIMDKYLQVDGERIKLSNPNKYLWLNEGITKMDYIQSLAYLSSFILLYSNNRLLSTIRYPDGFDKEFFYQKNAPNYTPEYVCKSLFKGVDYINLANTKTLIWLGTLASLEFHISFNTIDKPNNPTDIVFDLDPSKKQDFDDVTEVAILIYDILKELGITSFVKTSGGTGLQIYMPTKSYFTYDEARNISGFFAKYLTQRYPDKITIERLVSNRGNKLYFDYLQMWYGKTIIAPYSPRATSSANVTTPLTWNEVKKGIHPSDYNLHTIRERLESHGDIFSDMRTIDNNKVLSHILTNL